MYKIVSFPDIHLRFTILLSPSPLFLYHSHHPRNKDVCQADIITIFPNICYRPISMLLLLLLSFCMYELVLISPRKVNAWINVCESNRLNKWSICIEKVCAMFVHPGFVLSITCGGGHTVSLSSKGRADRGRVRETLRAGGHRNKDVGSLWGCDACLFCCHTGLRGKGWQTTLPLSHKSRGEGG